MSTSGEVVLAANARRVLLSMVDIDRDAPPLIAGGPDRQTPKRGRARIDRSSYENAEPSPKSPQQLLGRLNSYSAHVRIAAQLQIKKSGARLDLEKLGTQGRIHAVWILADKAERLLKIAGNDPEASVRAQAVRALADLAESDSDIASNLARLITDENDPNILREFVIALGRARWDGLAEWIARQASGLDHAAAQALRRSANPDKTLKLLDLSGNQPARKIALHALAEQAETLIANGLISRLLAESDLARQRELAELLARIYRKS